MRYEIPQIEKIKNILKKEWQNKDKNNIVFALIAAYILILPVPKITTVREFLFFSLFFLTIIDFSINKSKLDLRDIKIWFLYLSISIFSLFYAMDIFYSLEEIKKEIIYTIIIIFIISYWFKNDKNFLRLLKILILGNLIFIIASMYQIISLLVNNNINTTFQVSPFKMGVGNFSTYIILILPIILSGAIYYSKQNIKISFLLIILLILNIICLYFTSNRIGWFSLLGEIFVMLILMCKYNFLKSLNKKIIVLTSITIIIFLTIALVKLIERADNISLIQINNKHFQHLTNKIYESIFKDPRYPIWEVGINNIKEKPLTGGGFGREAFKLRNSEFSRNYPFGWHAHNMFLNKGVQMGIPGIVVFALLFIFLIKRFITICNHLSNERQRLIFPIVGIVATFGIILKNLTDDFFVRDQAWLFWIIVTAIMSTFDYKNKVIVDRKNNE